MKKLLSFTLGLCVLGMADANAAKPAKKLADDSKKPVLTAEQKAMVKELIAKYDADKDGELDKAEIKKMTKEEQAKYKAALAQVKKAEKKESKAAEKAEPAK